MPVQRHGGDVQLLGDRAHGHRREPPLRRQVPRRVDDLAACQSSPGHRPPSLLRTTALDGFDLTITAGEICGLIGHNGAGKTTFARIACGLDRPDSGRILIAGTDPARRTARRAIGWAPQEPALYPTATVRDNLRLFGGLAGLRRHRLRTEIDQVTAAMALQDLLDRPVGRLSGGQQRRVQTATALLHRPTVLLLDEPTTGADPATRQALLAVVRARADDGAAICYTTHYLPELVELDATLAVAAHGRVIARGPRQTLLDDLPGTALLRFDGPAPGHTHRDTLVITSPRPAEAAARALTGLGPEAVRLRGIDITPPALDDLYRRLASRESSHAA
ncbi:ABC transporter ATP-binding protein [Actinoallomurus purpureus]|uniref:ABC transporter ATP-binding protein n=1 Tax=Actinoallomurus purpureus TaxID=478114 RepID=UPI0020923F58|nr:ABC transporter ATP-binding protein [Actinoallomurus purpureus]MCO6004147.1 ABC transporter ATP-binding protein [Actinoallomurus purpureus]